MELEQHNLQMTAHGPKKRQVFADSFIGGTSGIYPSMRSPYSECSEPDEPLN